MQERLAVEHDFDLTGTEVSDANTGRHTNITTYSIVNAGTLTNAGNITASAAVTIGTTLDVTGNATIGGTLGVTGIATLGDGSQTTTSAAPAADAQIANKKYVDDSIGTAVYGRLSNSSAQSVSSGSDTKVTFNTADLDSGSICSTANNRITPGVAGYYLVSANVGITELEGSKYMRVRIKKNTTIIAEDNRTTSYGGASIACCATTFIDIDADDYIEVYVQHNQGSARDLATGSDQSLSVVRMR